MSRLRNLSPDAADDLDAIIGWMLDGGASAATAERALAAVLQAAGALARRPMLGRRLPDLLPEPFRFWSLPRLHLLRVYDPGAAPAMVLRIMSTDRDLRLLLAGLRAEPPG